MDSKALSKAIKRLEAAKGRLEEIKAATTFKEFESAWTEFLLALNGIYSSLEQGAKTNATSRQWFGKKKAERKKDTLLQYLHQARNADEHGIEPVTEFQGSSLEIGSRGKMTYIESLVFDDTGFTITASGENPLPDVTFTPPRAVLVTVHDTRFGDTFPPPTHHKGEKIDDDTPYSIAKLGFDAHAELITEAGKLVS